MDSSKTRNISTKNIIPIAIDADSIVYKACYRHQIESGVNIEQAYLEFGYEIGKVRAAVFKLLSYSPGDFVKPKIILSPKHTFRNDLSDEYKSNRIGKDNIHGIKQLKLMIMHRMGDWAMVVPNVEADDVVIYYSLVHNWLTSAIDKDVINASNTACYNYNSRSWNQANSLYDIERWYAKQCLQGDSADCIAGARGIGIQRAEQWVNKFVGEPMSWPEFCDMFGSEEEATRTMNLIRMDTLVEIDGKLVHKPWEPWDSDYWDF